MRKLLLLISVLALLAGCTQDPHADHFSREEKTEDVVFSQLHFPDTASLPFSTIQKGRLVSKGENDSAFAVIYLYNQGRENLHSYTKMEFSLNLEKPEKVFPVRWSQYDYTEGQPGSVVWDEVGQLQIKDSLFVFAGKQSKMVYKLRIEGKENEVFPTFFDAYWNPEYGILIYDGPKFYSELTEYRDVSYVQQIESLKNHVKQKYLPSGPSLHLR